MIIIAVALGLMAVVNIKTIESKSTMLAEYIREVAVAMELSDAAAQVSFEMRGYGYTEDKKFYQLSRVAINSVDMTLQKVRELDEKSKKT